MWATAIQQTTRYRKNNNVKTIINLIDTYHWADHFFVSSFRKWSIHIWMGLLWADEEIKWHGWEMYGNGDNVPRLITVPHEKILTDRKKLHSMTQHSSYTHTVVLSIAFPVLVHDIKYEPVYLSSFYYFCFSCIYTYSQYSWNCWSISRKIWVFVCTNFLRSNIFIELLISLREKKNIWVSVCTHSLWTVFFHLSICTLLKSRVK